MARFQSRNIKRMETSHRAHHKHSGTHTPVSAAVNTRTHHLTSAVSLIGCGGSAHTCTSACMNAFMRVHCRYLVSALPPMHTRARTHTVVIITRAWISPPTLVEPAFSPTLLAMNSSRPRCSAPWTTPRPLLLSQLPPPSPWGNIDVSWRRCAIPPRTVTVVAVVVMVVSQNASATNPMGVRSRLHQAT